MILRSAHKITFFILEQKLSKSTQYLMDQIEYPVNGELDLHTFQPQEAKSAVIEYINECFNRNIVTVRIVHGKGKSVQKFNIRNVLKSHPFVIDFSDAPPEAGGWGATIVHVKAK